MLISLTSMTVLPLYTAITFIATSQILEAHSQFTNKSSKMNCSDVLDSSSLKTFSVLQNDSLMGVILMAENLRNGKAESVYDVGTQQAVIMRQILLQENSHRASENESMKAYSLKAKVKKPRKVSVYSSFVNNG